MLKVAVNRVGPLAPRLRKRARYYYERAHLLLGWGLVGLKDSTLVSKPAPSITGQGCDPL